MAEKVVSEEKDKPILDEQTLAKLLEAAYVLQEQNREMHQMDWAIPSGSGTATEEPVTPMSSPGAAPTPEAEPAGGAYALALAEIVETQHHIQANHLGIENAMSLIAERLVQITRATGGAIGMLEGNKFHYQAVSGFMTPAVGTSIPMEKALCVACLRTGQVLRCADVNLEFLLDIEECRRRGIQSSIAVPIFREGTVAGGLELYYSKTQAFTEQDVHTCELMARLVTDSLARTAGIPSEVTPQQALERERAAILEALEKLKPSLTALANSTSAQEPGVRTTRSAASASPPLFDCRKCGHALVGEELFCGHCGSPRSNDYEEPNLQSKTALMWQMREAKQKPEDVDRTDGVLFGAQSQATPAYSDEIEGENFLPDSNEPPSIEQPGTQAFANAETHDATLENSADVNFESADPPTQVETTALVKPEYTVAWGSAATARDVLEKLAGPNQRGALAYFWRARRGDIYLAIAVILVAGVIRWGIWSDHSVRATGNTTAVSGHRKASPEADLSLFDRILIKVGVAEAPEPAEYKGNPDTQVWVDLQTALYYCPGADLYGKTPKGKFSSQRDARLDQFEPAYRKACD